MRDYKQTLPNQIAAQKMAENSQPTWTILTPKVRQFNFKEGETLEYHPLNDRAGHIIGFYRIADMIAFQDRLTRKHDWRLTPDLDNDNLTVSLVHDDMTDSPTVTIPLFAVTKERNDALARYRIAYQEQKKQQETAENDPDRDLVNDRLPAGRTLDGRYDSFCSNVYESLRPFYQKTQKHYIHLETAAGSFYFPLVKIRELSAALKPARSRDDDPVLSFSVTLDYRSEDVQVTAVSNNSKEFTYRKRWIKQNTPIPMLTIKSDGPVKITANVFGQMDRPMVINKEIVWSLPGLVPVASEKLSALMDAVMFLLCPPAPETLETAVPALETAPPAPETLETAVPALETAPPAPETLETAVPALETAPPALETLETAVPAVTRKNKRTGTRRRPDLLKMDVWSRLDYILSEDGIPADYLETLKSRKYKPVWA